MIYATIEELGTVVRGSSPRPAGDPRFYGGNIPRLMVSDVTRDGMYVTPKTDFLTPEGAEKSRPMLKGDLVLAVSGDPGEPSILKVDACIHDGFVGFRDIHKDRVDVEYLYHYLKFTKNKNKNQAVGAIFKNLNTDQIKRTHIPLPPLPVQRKIVAILDAADALRQKDRLLLKKYEELGQAVFLEMFGDPVRNERGFEIWPLGDLFDVKGGKRLPKGTDFATEKTSYAYIRVTDFVKNGFNDLKIKYITQETHEKIRNYTIDSEDVYISIAGTIGIAGFIPKHLAGANLTENAAKILPKKGTNSVKEYLSYYLNCPSVQSIIKSKTMAVGVPKLALFRIQEIPYACPPLEIQKKFAKSIKIITGQSRMVENAVAKSEELFGGLLEGVFRGWAIGDLE